MRKLFAPLFFISAAMFAVAPYLIANAPYEATMGLVQKIFYFHVPSWFAMFTGVFVCGFYSVMFLAKSKPASDRIANASAEIAVLFGLMGLVTGPLWGRKSWGVWWQWDAHLTMALLVELIFIGYLIVRKYGGPGSDKLAAAVAIFGMANIPFVYLSANIWRTLHPPTSVVPTLPSAMGGPFWYCVLAFMLLYSVLFMLRLRLANQQAALDDLFLEEE
jgi:heme exporter protein C